MTQQLLFPQASSIALILGGAGFIGRNVCREMSSRGFEVHAIGHGKLSHQEMEEYGIFRWVEADITLENLCNAYTTEVPDIVIHCCGSGSVVNAFHEPLVDFDRSVSTVMVMLEFAIRQPRPLRLVLISSAAVYGNQGDLDINENSRLNPVSPYGYNKVMAEMLCESYSQFFNIKTRIVRLFSVYGEGLRKQLLWDGLNKLKRGEFSFFGTGSEIRDWIHVSDASRLVATVATYNGDLNIVCNGGYVKATTREILTMLAQAAGSSLLPEFSGEIHLGNPDRLTADTSNTLEQLGFSGEVALKEGIQRYLKWFNCLRGIVQ
jgi:UDP-glucose 4-epimerase